ncbi:hypothetical protein [Streptomyces sp. NPDC058084]|uniref:hypothetical protein n=1 Tax=Streptomyces sp. NPDC058084 TaxID=3346333 RepID=UPI0036E8AA09
MDAVVAAVLAATVAGLASAAGVTTSALVTGRTAVVQAAEASRTEREKLAAERAQNAFDARREGYVNFHVSLVTAVQQIIALAEGPQTLAAGTTPTTAETRKAIREARMSLHKDVLMLGNTDVADAAQATLQDLEYAFRAAATLASTRGGDAAEEIATSAWENRYGCLEDRLQELATTMGQVMFGHSPT